jgi:ATP adenylyltransferase
LERLWSPWRAKYVASGVDSSSSTCVFCAIAQDTQRDETNFVIHRGTSGYVVLNLFPYTTGHLLVVPYQHIAELDATPKETTDELMDLTKRCQTALREVYQPSGFNLGMNLGVAAGAGIPDHLHLHILPRWSGDTNFMTTIAGTRVLPEELNISYARLRPKF